MLQRKTVKGFSKYEADTDGNIYSKRTGKKVNVRIHHCCPEVMLTDDEGNQRHCVPSRLILSTFRDIEGAEGLDIHHLDLNQFNNNIKNLIWVDRWQHKQLHKLINDQTQKVFSFGNN